MKIRQREWGSVRPQSRRGSALVMSLVAVSTVVVLAASFSQFASSVANRQAQAVNKKRAFYMAEAGLAEAYAGFSCGKSGTVGSIEAPALLGAGLFWVEVTELDADVVRLQSTGMVGTGRAELSLVARRGVQSVASLGVFSEGVVSLGAGSLVDAYDSTMGSYASQADHGGAVLGSNGNITITGAMGTPSVVKGDVTPGAQATLTTVGSVTISGSTSKALQATELPPVEVPELALAGAQVQGSPYPLVIPAGSAGYESLTIQSGSQVIIQGPAQVVLGKLAVQSSGQLSFDTTQGAVELYVTDALDFASGSLLTSTSSRPQDVTIQVPAATAQPIGLRATGPFHGVIFAPDASVTVGGSFEMFGALVASELSFEGAAKLHFDLHLAQIAADLALPRMVSWRIVELASSSSDLSMDPFEILDVDPSTLAAPASSHLDQLLEIHYYDFSSVYHTYNGPESSFDWNVVKDVIFASRDGIEVRFPRAPNAPKGTLKSPGVAPVVDGAMI